MTLELLRIGNALDLPSLAAGCVVGGQVRTAGILPLDPTTGEVVEGGIEAQARQALANLVMILDAAGAQLTDVSMVEIYLADIRVDLGPFNRVYAEYFDVHHPPRIAVGVELAWPSLAVELRAVAELVSSDREAEQ